MPTVTSALDVVDGEVRELVRRRGLDPFSDPAPVRVLVRDVIADYSERSLTSALPPIGDAESVVRDVLDRVAGFGPLQRHLDDPEVEEIWVNYPLQPLCLVRTSVHPLSPHGVRTVPEDVAQHRRRRLAGPILSGRPQVAVDVQGQ